MFITLDSQCPISGRYRPVLNRLAEQYPSVVFYGVTPGHLQPPAQTFPVLLDPHFTLSRQLQAQLTPEVFVYDATGQLRYRGRIDDQYVDYGKTRTKVTREDLRLALDALLAHRPVPVTRQRGVGCWIEYGAR